MTINQLKAQLTKTPNGYFKYIRVGNEFRFSDITEINGLTHKGLQHSNKANGAGFLRTFPNGMYIEGYSLTLKMGSGSGDEELLSELLNLPICNL